MRIAQVAPLYESVPPRLYGGTERVVHYLTESLVEKGHDVTLFASGDSSTSARLVPCCPEALRLGKSEQPLAHHILMLEEVCRMAADFEVLHFHCDFLHFAMARRQPIPALTTLHGRLDIPDLIPLYQEFRDMPLISISNSQRVPIAWANWQATIYHGLPTGVYSLGAGAGGYLAFVGRIAPEKRVDRAIEIARRAGVPLKIAAKVDRVDQEYFDAQIRPLLRDPDIEFVGEIGDREKNGFYGDALGLLFPIDWPEPFGLVMIESMACGTPVIAWNCGSVPEIVDEGVTGFVVNTFDDALRAVQSLQFVDRLRCRQVSTQRFSADRMAAEYISAYSRLRSSWMLEAVGSD